MTNWRLFVARLFLAPSSRASEGGGGAGCRAAETTRGRRPSGGRSTPSRLECPDLARANCSHWRRRCGDRDVGRTSRRRTIGVVLARGASEAAEAIVEATGAVASMLGPAIRARLDAAVNAQASAHVAPEILGNSPAMTRVREALAQAASTGFPVLVEGDSGTGKELVARAIHRLGARRDRRFSAINCAALTDELIEGRALRAHTGCLHGRSGASRRPVRGGPWRHVVPR